MVGNKEIDEANQIVIERILNSNPILVDIKPAIDAIPGMKKNLLLCAGPPINWSQMCEPVKAAILGAIVYENFADTLAEAEQIVLKEDITVSASHKYAAGAPMAVVISL